MNNNKYYTFPQYPDILNKRIIKSCMDITGVDSYPEYVERLKYTMNEINRPKDDFDFYKYTKVYEKFYERKGIYFKQQWKDYTEMKVS